MVQKHLTYKEMTDYGCFYTPQKFVDKLIDMVKANIEDYEEYTFLDSSCGYASFLKSLSPLRTIGCDIDKKAIEIARENYNESTYYTLNSLVNFSRSSVNLTNDDKLIIIGNPPYNDTTSKVKSEIKKTEPCQVDNDIKTRDLGISFLLSYNKLNPNYVAVLHPLSYMIKKANFELLRPFYNNYKLIDHCVINSQEFSLTSTIKGFPIIIALYKKSDVGMRYSDICDMTFQTITGDRFNLRLNYIKNYIKKYPSKTLAYKDGDILFFTMRDINALNRSKTFIQEFSDNAIIVDKDKFAYYAYVDAFKDYISKLPYYYGNCDVFIDNNEFLKIKDVFVTRSMEKHPWLMGKVSFEYINNYKLIDEYFKKLFSF